MKLIVIGLGSMGKRRIRLIQKYNDQFEILGVDTRLSRRQECEKKFGMKTFGDLADIANLEEIDCAFVCTSPLTHSSIIKMCLSNGLHVFTELNLIADGYDENIELSKKMNKVLFLSSTFLYRSEIRKIKELVNEDNKVHNYTYHVGQYLPDWHPWEHFSEFFVNDKRTNGCREIFAIELPWIIDVFGPVKKLISFASDLSSLNLEYPDSYTVVFEHENGSRGTLNVDVVSRKPVRNLEVFNENLYLSWNGTPSGLNLFDYDNSENINLCLYDNVDTEEGYKEFIVENSYFDEIEGFFDEVIDRKMPLYSFEKDREVLRIIDKIEVGNGHEI